jgi:hypothetical protein
MVRFTTVVDKVIHLESAAGLLNYPAASCGVSEFADKTCSSGVTPECFYRGSSLNFAWIPAKGMRE